MKAKPRIYCYDLFLLKTDDIIDFCVLFEYLYDLIGIYYAVRVQLLLIGVLVIMQSNIVNNLSRKNYRLTSQCMSRVQNAAGCSASVQISGCWQAPQRPS